MKRLILNGLHLVVASLMVIVVMLYGCLSAAMLTRVINDFRLDTYLGAETGLAIILLLVMVVYIPIWFMINLAKKR